MSKNKYNRWSSYGLPYSLINISCDVLATKNNDVIRFIDIKDKTCISFNATTAPKGCGVSVMAGHAVLSVFAFAAQTMVPIIRVLSYPSFNVISQFDSPDVTSYKDLYFSKGDHLIAQTSFPNYTIRVLNFRSNEVLMELNTFHECEYGSILCSHSYLPTISQYSKYKSTIFFYDLCYQTDGYILPEISSITITADQSLSTRYNKCFSEDNMFYMVNDYGHLLLAEIGLFELKTVWRMPSEKADIDTKPRAYILQFGKQGVLIANSDSVHFVKQIGNEWVEEFNILNLNFHLKKIVTDLHGNLYMADSKSNLFVLDVVDKEGVLNPLNNNRFRVNKFASLKGIREEAVLVLTDESELILFDLVKKNKLSEITIEGLVHISTHDTHSYAVVGNDEGVIYFLSYVRINEPTIMTKMELDTPKIKSIKIYNKLVVVLDIFDSIIVISAVFELSSFFQRACIYKPIEEMSILDFFLVSKNKVLVLYNLENDIYWPQANLMCMYEWSTKDETLKVSYYELPFHYVSFTASLIVENNIFELCGARAHDVIIDVFAMNLRTGDWTYTDAIQTIHNSFVHSISMSRNLITSSVSSTYIHFRMHTRSRRPFSIAKLLELNFVPNLPKAVEVLFVAKYLLSLHKDKCLQIHTLKNLGIDLKENTFLPIPTALSILEKKNEEEYPLTLKRFLKKVEPTPAEIAKRGILMERINQLSKEVFELIEYDIEIAGVTKGMFRKFCLNLDWLDKLTEEADQICKVEAESILKATQDQARIRDWIYGKIFAGTEKLSYRVRALFTNVYCENYSTSIRNKRAIEQFDLFRFHDMEEPENELEELIRESLGENNAEEHQEEEENAPHKYRKLYAVKGDNVFKHVISEELYVQSKDEISYFQMHNTKTKFKISLNDPMISEFNKYFDETVDFKKQIIDNILSTNDVLRKIYSNMNIMRKLLIMDTFTPPELSVPTWTKDENLEKILTVDDSEIKAINRRKKKAEDVDTKSGRMLLWALEFWERALMVMMDGVLEKLWEEEIKKDIPIPEFVAKKDPHQYNLTEQKQYREYLEKVRLLELDRRKYLGILQNNEIKVHNMKKNFILKLNEHITELYILKLKYDYILKRCNLQLINTKIIHCKRMQYQVTYNLMKEDFEKILEYINSYSKLCTFWEMSIKDVKLKLDNLQNRDRATERKFRTNFLNVLPPQFIPEFRKLYKRCPKLNKHILSVLLCDLIGRVLEQNSTKQFPIPQSANEFFSALEELDDVKYNPNQLDQKTWETFVAQRRKRIINFLNLKTWSLRLTDVQNAYKRHSNNLSDLKILRNLCISSMDKTRNDFKSLLKNRSLVLTLTLGQVEVSFSSTSIGFKNSILMHVDDVLEVNAKIKAAGLRKIRAMQRVALFRRQVIAREWDHEVTKANIKYLEYMLNAIEKTKVTKEFLEVLYKWEKEQRSRKSTQAHVGLIEQQVEIKVAVATARLDRYIKKIEEFQRKIKEMKIKNVQINKKIEELKINHALSSVYLDELAEEKRTRDQEIRMRKIKERHRLLRTVREDYAHILELKALLEIERLRTYPDLSPAPPDCPDVNIDIVSLN